MALVELALRDENEAAATPLRAQPRPRARAVTGGALGILALPLAVGVGAAVGAVIGDAAGAAAFFVAWAALLVTLLRAFGDASPYLRAAAIVAAGSAAFALEFVLGLTAAEALEAFLVAELLVAVGVLYALYASARRRPR